MQGSHAMLHSLKNIWRLGVKELWSLWRDPVMLVLIVYTFTASVYTAATAMPETLHNAPIAIVDEDQSPLSARIARPSTRRSSCRRRCWMAAGGPGMDAGASPCADHSPNFQRDVLAGKKAELQLNVDATRMSQAFSGSGYMQQIVWPKSTSSCSATAASALPVDLELRALQPG
jgi:ABC-2 type transport system permease protein